MSEKQQYNNSDFKGKEDHEATPTASVCGFTAFKTLFKTMIKGKTLLLQISAALPLQEAWVRLSVGETSAPHSDVLQQPKILHLMAAALLLKQQRGLDVVGLDAADIVGFLQRAAAC